MPHGIIPAAPIGIKTLEVQAAGKEVYPVLSNRLVANPLFVNNALFVPIVIILVFVVCLGFFVCYLGFQKRRGLRGMLRLNADIESIKLPTFEANISWMHRGTRYYSSSTGLHAISRKDRVKILLDPQTSKHYIDIWTHNGKGLILGGTLISFLGGLALFLFLMFS